MDKMMMLLIMGCCMFLSSVSGRSLLDEPYDSLKDAISTSTDEACGKFGKCEEGYVCKPTEATRCTRDVTPKTQCSKEKVCVSGSTKCGNSVCSVDEKCGVADSCKPDLEKIKASVKAGDKDSLSQSQLLDPACWVCQPRETCIETTVQECYEDPDDCEEVPCDDLEKVCETTTEKKCKTVVKPDCKIISVEECKDVESDVCVEVQTSTCEDVTDCVEPEPSCKTVSVEVCEPVDCECEPVKKNICDEKEECKTYPRTICKEDEDGKEVCSKEEEKKCETVEVNCRDVEFCDCDGEEEPYEVKPPECTQEEETVCIEVEPVCTTTKDEDCEPEYEEQCTKEVSQECTPLELEECVDVEEETCEDVPVELCKYVPSKECEGATKVCKEKCEPKTTKDCEASGVDCNGKVCSKGEICDYKCEVVYGEQVCTKEDFYRCIPDWVVDNDP